MHAGSRQRAPRPLRRERGCRRRASCSRRRRPPRRMSPSSASSSARHHVRVPPSPAALANASLNGSLTGGLYNGGISTVPAQGTLTITANVLDKFLYMPVKNLVKDDPLLNRAEISGLVAGSLMTCTDDGYSCLAVP